MQNIAIKGMDFILTWTMIVGIFILLFTFPNIVAWYAVVVCYNIK